MLLAAGSPFISSYIQSDGFGKGIFWGLFLLSALSWWVLIHKFWIFFSLKRLSQDFLQKFSEKDPLGLQLHRPLKSHPFFEVYKIFKYQALQMFNQNALYLSTEDIELIASRVYAATVSECKKLEKNLFILSTIVTLGPFLGLLGTVWGILVTFSGLQTKGLGAVSNAAMLSGLSLALSTTVVGLIVAIPALVGYNYLKDRGKEYRQDLESFSHLLLTSIELHYKRSNHAKKDLSPIE